MKLINQSFEIIDQEDYTIRGIKRFIERCARVSYKSEDRITNDSYEKFVNMLIANQHLRPLEFGTVYLTYDTKPEKYIHNPWSKVYARPIRENEQLWYVTTNYRVIIENRWESDLINLCAPTKYHYKRHTVHFILNRAIMDEFRTHVGLSHLAESTRYCNYSKDKFGNDITFICPSWIEMPKEITDINELCLLGRQYDDTNPANRFLASLVESKYAYLSLLDKGHSPQEARDVLPLAIKSELISCGFKDAWDNFIAQRCHKSAHPMAREIANPLRERFFRTL